GDSILDLLLARGGDEHLDLILAGGGRTQHLEVEVDLVEGERNVLVGLALDLDFHLFFPLVAREDHLLGDHRGAGKREGDVLDSRTEVLVGALDSLARRLDVGNVAVDDSVLRQRLYRVTFYAVDITPGLGDLDHLDGRRTDV